MAVILSFVIDALSLLNLDSLKKTPYHMDSLPCLRKKRAAFLFFYTLLTHGVAALKMNANLN